LTENHEKNDFQDHAATDQQHRVASRSWSPCTLLLLSDTQGYFTNVHALSVLD